MIEGPAGGRSYPSFLRFARDLDVERGQAHTGHFSPPLKAAHCEVRVSETFTPQSLLPVLNSGRF